MTHDSHKPERLEGEVRRLRDEGMGAADITQRLRGYGAWSRIRQEKVEEVLERIADSVGIGTL